MSRLIRDMLLLVATMLAATWVAWWLVPVVGAAYGAVKERPRAAGLIAGLAAFEAWGLLLLVAANRGPAMELAQTLGAILKVGAGGVIMLTVLFPALLAGSAAATVAGVRKARGAA